MIEDLELEKLLEKKFDLGFFPENKLKAASKSIEKIIEDIRKLSKRSYSDDLQTVENAKDISDPFLANALGRLVTGHK